MQIKTTIIGLIFISIFSFASSALGADGWEADIRVKVENAENRLIIGQWADAEDGIDNKYEITALLSGDVIAYIDNGGKALWRDIKSVCNGPCAKTWDIFIESPLTDKYIKLNWNVSALPSDMKVVLEDLESGKIYDMKKEPQVTYKNTGKKHLMIEVTK